MLSSKFAGDPAVVDGYVLAVSVARKPDGSSWYKITADPQDKSTGTNHLYLDADDGYVHVNSERQADPNDPVN